MKVKFWGSIWKERKLVGKIERWNPEVMVGEGGEGRGGEKEKAKVFCMKINDVRSRNFNLVLLQLSKATNLRSIRFSIVQNFNS